MKTRLLHLFFIVAAVYNANAQTPDWTKDASHCLSLNTDAVSAVTDNSGNTYALVNFNNGAGGNSFSSILKYNTSGAVTDTISLDSMYVQLPYGIVKHQLIYDNGYLFAFGYDTYLSNPCVIKLNSAGVKQWRYKTANLYTFYDMTLDASGNIYVAGMGSGSNFPARVEKIGSSGVRTWGADYDLNTANGFDEFYAVKVDNTGNVYATGYGQKDATESRNIITVKFNSSGIKQWDIDYNGTSSSDDYGYDLAVDNGGNVYVTGWGDYSGTYIDYVTIKYNSSGTQQWFRQYNNPANSFDYPFSILIDGNNDIIVGGKTGDACNYSAGIVKYNSSGTKQWDYTPPSNCRVFTFASMVTDVSNNIYIAGTITDSLNTSYTNQVIYKVNSAGALQWTKQVNNNSLGDDRVHGLSLDNSGKPVICGSFNTLSAGTSSATANIVKFNASGVSQWSATYRAAFNSADNHITVLADKNGNAYTIGNTEEGTAGWYIDKRTKSGSLAWHVFKTGVLNSGAGANAAMLDVQGNIYVCGWRINASYTEEMIAVKYNSSGTELWTAVYQASMTSPQRAYDIAVDASSNVYITGTGYKDFTQNQNIYTLKFNSGGVQQWVAEYNGQDRLDKGIAIDVDASGKIFVTGIRTDSTNTTNWITLKYNASGAQQWATQSGLFNKNDFPQDIKADNNGGCYVTGKSYITTKGEFTTIKFNSSGVASWTKYLSNYFPSCSNYNASGKEIEIDNSGNIYVTGSGYNCVVSNNNYPLLCQKYNSNGDSLWGFIRAGYNSSYINGNDIKYDITSIDTVRGALYISNLVYLSGQPVNYYKSEIIKLNTSNAAIQWVYADSILGTAANGVTLPNNSLSYDGVAAVFGCYDVTTNKTYSDSRTIKICEAPVATATAGGPATFCQGGSVTVTANASSVGSFLWNNGATTASIIATVSGNYKCTVTYTDGCPYTTNVVTVTVNPLPGTTVIPSGPTSFCTGGSVNLTASGTGTLLWSNGSTNATITVNATGNYKAVRTSSQGCKDSATITITVSSLPSANITPAGPTTFCAGTTPLTLGANSGTNFTYKWKKGSNYLSGATSQTYQPTASGTYKVEVTNPGGCTKLSSGLAVTVNALPAATITPQGPLTFCAGDSVVLQAGSGSGLTYQWKKGSNNINGATSQNYNAKTAATYKVIVTNTNGCSKTSSGVKVVINCRLGENGYGNASVYPNPAGDVINLEFFSQSDDSYIVTINDVTGREVYKETIAAIAGENRPEFNTSMLSEGVYLLKIKSSSVEHILRFVKE